MAISQETFSLNTLLHLALSSSIYLTSDILSSALLSASVSFIISYQRRKAFLFNSFCIIFNPMVLILTVNNRKSTEILFPMRKEWQPTPVILAWEIPWTEEPGRL